MAAPSSSYQNSKRKPSYNNNKNDGSNKKPKVDLSSLSSSKQKRVLKQERQSHRRHATVVKDSKEVWSKLRLKNNTPEQIKPLQEKLLELLFENGDSTICEIALQHDASRVVQAAIQFASPAERLLIATALAPQLPEMSKVQYAHFCVLKLIQYGHMKKQNECVAVICKAFKGQLCKLATHAVGARVVEMLFSTLAAKHTNSLKQEFYGPHFSLFAKDAATATTKPSLQSNIKAQPDKKETACDYLYSHLLQKGIDKGLFGFAYFQQLLSDYCTVQSGTELRSQGFLSNLVDHTLHLISTRAGAHVMVTCAAYGTAKDRKRMLKALKGYTRSSLLHRDAYLVILQLCLVTDDTVSVQKSLLAELLVAPEEANKGNEAKDFDAAHPMLELALDDQASKLFLQLSGFEKTLDPLEQSLLQTNPTVTENGEEVPTCKKNPDTRRNELLAYLPLVKLCLQHPFELAQSLPGSRVLQQVTLMTSSSDNDDELITKIVELCVVATDDSLLHDKIGHYMVKHLVTHCDAFGVALSKAVSNDELLTSSRAAFCATALHAKHPLSIKKAAVQKAMKLQKSKKEATAGYEALLKAL